MPLVDLQEVKAWAERTKLTLGDFDDDLLSHITSIVIARLVGTFDTSAWVDPATTPALIRTIISMRYVSAVYRRSFADEADAPSSYPFWLEQQTDDLLEGLIDGTIDLPELPSQFTGTIAFYPTDSSSALEPSSSDGSLGPSTFSMGSVF
jgi:hypothetical protein